MSWTPVIYEVIKLGENTAFACVCVSPALIIGLFSLSWTELWRLSHKAGHWGRERWCKVGEIENTTNQGCDKVQNVVVVTLVKLNPNMTEEKPQSCVTQVQPERGKSRVKATEEVTAFFFLYLVFRRSFIIAISLNLQTGHLHLPDLVHAIHRPDEEARK